MARYFFDVLVGGRFDRDEIGGDYAGFEQARRQCRSMLPDIARAELIDGDLPIVTCRVRDETGRVVYRGDLTFRGARPSRDGRGAPSGP